MFVNGHSCFVEFCIYSAAAGKAVGKTAYMKLPETAYDDRKQSRDRSAITKL